MHSSWLRQLDVWFDILGQYCEEATVVPGECPEGSYMPYGVTPDSATSDPYCSNYVRPGEWGFPGFSDPYVLMVVMSALCIPIHCGYLCLRTWPTLEFIVHKYLLSVINNILLVFNQLWLWECACSCLHAYVLAIHKLKIRRKKTIISPN